MSSLNTMLGLDRFGRSGLSGLAGLERRRRGRLSLLDETPEHLQEDLLGRIRTAPPESVRKSPHGALQYALEILDLPRNTIANLVNNAFVRAKPTSKMRAFGMPKVGGHDILREAGLSAGKYGTKGKVADFLAGFLADVAMDPLMYLTLGTSAILGTAGKKIGKHVFTEAGKKAVGREMRQLEGQLGRRVFKREVEAGIGKREAGRRARAGVTERLEKLGEAPRRRTWRLAARDRKLREEMLAKLATPLTPLARQYAGEQGRKKLGEMAAHRVARRTPGALDPNVIGLTTEVVKRFSPFDIPVMLAGAPATVLAPKIAGPVVQGYMRHVRPLTQPFRWLPSKSVTLLKRGRAGDIAGKLGLDRFGRRVADIQGVRLLGESLREFGRGAKRRLRTEPLPARPGDIRDQIRYETEAFERWVAKRTQQRMRGIAWTERPKLRAMVQQIAKQCDLPEPLAGEVAFALAEERAAVEAGTEHPGNVIERLKDLFKQHGEPAEKVNRIQGKLLDAAPDLAPAYDLDLYGKPVHPSKIRQQKLFSEAELEAVRAKPKGEPVEITDGLRQMVAGVVRKIPGKKRPGVELVRNALIEKYGSAAVARQLKVAGSVHYKQALPEIEEAIEQAEKGMRLFQQPDLAPGRTLGEPVTMVDSELNDYAGTLELVDVDQLGMSHRAVKLHGKVVRLEAVPDYPPGFQARQRDAEASVKQVAGIARKPSYPLLLEFGREVTGGPPVTALVEGREIVVQGNGRAAGMRAWTKPQWEQYKAALRATGVDPGEIAKPVLVRRMRGTAEDARKLASLGQESAGLRQTVIEKARGMLQAMGVKGIDDIPIVHVDKPIVAENVLAFIESPANREFRQWLVGGLAQQRREELLASPVELTEKVNAVFLAMLPESVKAIVAEAPRKLEDMFVAAAPYAAYLHSMVRAGTVRPEYDLYNAMGHAAHFYKSLKPKRGSYRQLIADMDEIAETASFAGMRDEMGEAGSARGVALAVGMVRASRAADPSATMTDGLKRIVAGALADDPKQIGMFAGVEPAEAAAEIYMRALMPPREAERLLANIKHIEGASRLQDEIDEAARVVREAGQPAEAAGRPAEVSGAEDAGAGVPPAETAPPPSPEHGDIYSDLERYGREKGVAAEQVAQWRVVLDNFHPDALRRLRMRAGTEEEAAKLFAEKGIRPAGAFDWRESLLAPEVARLDADGLIRLFNKSGQYDDMGLFLEEAWHHAYRNLLSDADREAVRGVWQSRRPGEWERIIAKGPGGAEHAPYYVRNANELASRLFADWAMARTLERQPELESIFERAMRVLAEVWEKLTGRYRIGGDQRLKRIFVRYYRPPLATAQKEGAAKLAEGLGLERFGLSQAAREAGVPASGARQMHLPFARETPGVKMKLADPVNEIVDYIQARDVLRLAEMRAAEVPQGALTTRRQIGYMTRFWLDGPNTLLGKVFRKGGMSIKSRMQMRRNPAFREKFASEINRIAREVNDILAGKAPARPEYEGLIEHMGLKSGDVMPTVQMDPVTAHIARELESVRTIGSAEFLRETMRRFGQRIARGKAVPEGFTFVKAGQFGDLTKEYAIPTEAAHVIEKHIGMLTEPNKPLNAYRRMLSWWKGWVLVAPAYHARNVFSNVWNLNLLDAWDAEAQQIAREIQKAIARGDERLLARKIKGTTETYGSLYKKLAVDYGMVGSGFFGIENRVYLDSVGDMLDVLEHPVSARELFRQVRGRHPLKANMVLGRMCEESAKIGGVIARLRGGDDMAQAAETVTRALFDYADLTPFLRGTPTGLGVRDIIPFLTWTRKNAGLLLTIAATSPRKLAIVPKIQLSAEGVLAGEEALPASLRPKWIQKEGGIQVSGGLRPRFLNIGYMLPVGELRYLNPFAPGRAARAVGEEIGGPLRTAGELLYNRDIFRNRPISEYPAQRKTFLGVDMPPLAKQVGRMFRPLNVAEQMRREVARAQSPADIAGMAAAQGLGIRAFTVNVAGQIYEQEQRFNDQVGAVRRDMKRRINELTGSGAPLAGDGELRRLTEIHERLISQREGLPLPEVRRLRRGLSTRRRQMLDQYLEQYRAQAPTAMAG